MMITLTGTPKNYQITDDIKIPDSSITDRCDWDNAWKQNIPVINASRVFINRTSPANDSNVSFISSINETYPNTITPSARILLSDSGDGYLTADGNSFLIITAMVKDERGAPAIDGTGITFTINSDPGANNTWFSPKGGTLSINGSNQNLQSATAKTLHGQANVSFGWLDSEYDYIHSGKNLVRWNDTITAMITGDPVNNSTVTINYCYLTSWYGSVMDKNGKGVNHVNVTLHVMGEDGSSPVYEIYNRTTETPTDPMYPGQYIFNNLPLWSNVSYGYTACSIVYDGISLTSLSRNISFYTEDYGGFMMLQNGQNQTIIQ